MNAVKLDVILKNVFKNRFNMNIKKDLCTDINQLITIGYQINKNLGLYVMFNGETLNMYLRLSRYYFACETMFTTVATYSTDTVNINTITTAIISIFQQAVVKLSNRTFTNKGDTILKLLSLVG